ncbi:hypothetical protein HOLleu_27399 [Holothuria leucospilota]|uniref:Uncharacterized protein n=1 Tax=Holothuria leucospilota TaxID=206669 RepID=A0A9Q1BQP5_HOLLE|nr:hypothetical protein HOLleu_27399 [Holothuria leucospilota]
MLPCTAAPRQSRVVLGELIIPQPRPRIGGKQSTLNMFFKPVPVSPSSSTSILNSSTDKESSHTFTKTSSQLNPGGDTTEPLLESMCNVLPESLAGGDSEESFGIIKENNICDMGIRSENCEENAVDGFTGCTVDENSSGTATCNTGHSSKEDNSEASVIGKCSYVFHKVDLTDGLGARKRPHGLIESAGKSFLVQDVPSKRYRTESYSTQEDVIETSNFGNCRRDNRSETKGNYLSGKGNTDNSFKVSCLPAKCESVNSESVVNKPGKSLKINRTLTSQSDLLKTTSGAKVHDKNSLISQNDVCSDMMDDSLQSISEKFVNRKSTFASQSNRLKDLTEANDDDKSDLKSQNYAPLEMDNSLQSSASFEDSLSADDSLTPAILRNSIYRELNLTSDLPLTNAQPSHGKETSSCNSDEIPDTVAFDSLHDWSVSENYSTETTKKF